MNALEVRIGRGRLERRLREGEWGSEESGGCRSLLDSRDGASCNEDKVAWHDKGKPREWLMSRQQERKGAGEELKIGDGRLGIAAPANIGTKFDCVGHAERTLSLPA